MQQSGRSREDAGDEYLTEQAIEEEFDRKLEQIEREMELRSKSLGRWALVLLFITLLLAVSIWRDRHRDAAALLEPADVLIDGMRGPSSLWYRIRINLEHVPPQQRPAQEELIADYSPWRRHSGRRR